MIRGRVRKGRGVRHDARGAGREPPRPRQAGLHPVDECPAQELMAREVGVNDGRCLPPPVRPKGSVCCEGAPTALPR